MKTEKIELVKMDLIDRPVKIARELIDPEKVRELAESIREVGLLEPVLLASRNGRYEMVAGDRRYLAHKLLNLKVIKAIVRELDDREVVILRGIENLQRVNLTPSEQGRLYLVLHNEGGLTWEQIAKKTGKAVKSVKLYVHFAGLPEEVRWAVDNKKVRLGDLDILEEIDDPEAFLYYFRMAVNSGVNDSTARLWVDDYKKTQLGTYYSDGGGGPSVDLPVEAKPVFMTCEVCHSPCEIKAVRNLVVCPDCRKKVRHG